MLGTGIAKGMSMTMRTLFRRPFTVQYPEEVRPVPVNARTNLLWFEERCTGCSTCAQACPIGCILVQTSPRPDGSLNVDRYEIDFRLCLFCGLCAEACPYEAIQTGGPFDDAAYDFDKNYRDKHVLTGIAQTFLQTHDWTYPTGKRAPQPEEFPVHTGKPVERDRLRGAGMPLAGTSPRRPDMPIPVAGRNGGLQPLIETEAEPRHDRLPVAPRSPL